MTLPTLRAALGNLRESPLVRDATALAIVSVGPSILGFGFWALAARLVPASDLGLITALLSSSALVVAISNFGLGFAVIRFGAHPRASAIGAAALRYVSISTAIGATIYAVLSPVISTKLGPIVSRPPGALVFVAVTAALGANAILDKIQLSEGKRKVLVRRHALTSLGRFLALTTALMPAFARQPGSGTYTFLLLMSIAPMWFGISGLIRRIRPAGTNPITFEVVQYSLANWLSEVIAGLPSTALPLIVLSTLSSTSVAHFYFLWTIFALVSSVANSVAMATFNRGSSESIQRPKLITQSLRLGGLTSIGMAIGVAGLAPLILGLLGSEYQSELLQPLRVLSLALLPGMINGVMLSLLRIEKRYWQLILMAAASSAVPVACSVIVVPLAQLTGFSYLWLATQSAVGVVSAVGLLRRSRVDN